MRRILDERGSASVAALWTLTMLTLLAAGHARQVRLAARETRYAEELLRARLLAVSGVNRALAELELHRKATYHALDQLWGTSEEAFREVRLEAGWFTVAHRADPDTLVRYGLVDEERKISLNTAPREVLLRLPGVDAGIAAALIDWRDADDIPEPDGAEDTYYRSLPHPYTCKNGPLETVEELQLVRGMTPALLQGLEPYVTVYGDGRVNINTAPAPVLRALGLDAELSRAILRFRQGADGQEGTRDDRAFREISGLADHLTDFAALSSGQVAAIDSMLPALTVKSQHFRIEAVGQTESGAVRRVQAVASVPAEAPVWILFWHEE